jgi:hypothetical protein
VRAADERAARSDAAAQRSETTVAVLQVLACSHHSLHQFVPVSIECLLSANHCYACGHGTFE